MIAGHGFVVAVPEIFHELEPAGTVLPYDKAGTDSGNAPQVARPVSAYDEDARVGLDYLDGLHPAAAGGSARWGSASAATSPSAPRSNPGSARPPASTRPTSTAAPWARAATTRLDRAGDIKGELLMVWGRQDPHIPPRAGALIQQRADGAGVISPGTSSTAPHAFMRDEGYRYDPALALIGYRLALDLFARTLGGPIA